MATPIFNEQIAPLIKQLAKLCQEADLPMFVTVQDGPESFRTSCVNANLSKYRKLQWLMIANRAWTTDELIRGLLDDAYKNGHDSDMLEAIGVPREPMGVPRHYRGG